MTDATQLHLWSWFGLAFLPPSLYKHECLLCGEGKSFLPAFYVFTVTRGALAASYLPCAPVASSAFQVGTGSGTAPLNQAPKITSREICG